MANRTRGEFVGNGLFTINQLSDAKTFFTKLAKMQIATGRKHETEVVGEPFSNYLYHTMCPRGHKDFIRPGEAVRKFLDDSWNPVKINTVKQSVFNTIVEALFFGQKVEEYSKLYEESKKVVPYSELTLEQRAEIKARNELRLQFRKDNSITEKKLNPDQRAALKAFISDNFEKTYEKTLVETKERKQRRARNSVGNKSLKALALSGKSDKEILEAIKQLKKEQEEAASSENTEVKEAVAV